MARKILVVNDGSFVTKNRAHAERARLTARWEEVGVSIRRLEVQAVRPSFQSGLVLPEVRPGESLMPPLEIGGCKYVPPAAWKPRQPHFIPVSHHVDSSPA